MKRNAALALALIAHRSYPALGFFYLKRPISDRQEGVREKREMLNPVF